LPEGSARRGRVDFQVSGKMHGINARLTRYGETRVCSGKHKGRAIATGGLFILCASYYADDPAEVRVHIGSVIVVIWLIIGGFAAGQRGDYQGPVNCSRAATAAVTILVGPLNYAGVNPHISCAVAHPSD
jgi:hypothetical protein